MAAQAPSIEIPSTTFTWKKDSSAGDIPAEVYYGRKAAEEGPHPISKSCIMPTTTLLTVRRAHIPRRRLGIGIRGHNP